MSNFIVTTTFEEWKASRIVLHRSDPKDIMFFDDWDVQCERMFVYCFDRSTGSMQGYIGMTKGFNRTENNELNQFDLFDLVLENQEWFVTRDGLDELEHRLYDWLKDQECFDERKPTPSEMRQRLFSITHNAIDDFWHTIATDYNEIETGDLGPVAKMDFEQACFKVVTTWCDNNGGGQQC